MRGILTVELNAGQMVEDVRLSARRTRARVPLRSYGRYDTQPHRSAPSPQNDFSRTPIKKKAMTPEEIIKHENKVYSRPRLLTENVTHYCPGCSHGWYTA